MFEDLYMTENEKIERQFLEWRDEYYAATKDARILTLDRDHAETLMEIWQDFIQDERIISTLLNHLLTIDSPSLSYRVGAFTRIHELTTLLLDDEQQAVVRGIESENLVRSKGRAAPHPQLRAFLHLIILYAMLTDNQDAVPELASLDLWITGHRIERDGIFVSLLDYIDEGIDTPLTWWLNLTSPGQEDDK